jgi:hypothetical protein
MGKLLSRPVAVLSLLAKDSGIQVARRYSGSIKALLTLY